MRGTVQGCSLVEAQHRKSQSLPFRLRVLGLAGKVFFLYTMVDGEEQNIQDEREWGCSCSSERAGVLGESVDLN